LPAEVCIENVEVWFQDETRIGQQGSITRQWFKKGFRPRAVRQQQFLSAYIFGAVCPELNKAAAIVSPFANTSAMNEHLAEIGNQVAPGKHAVLLMDRAGWHRSENLIIPNNISILYLPPSSPELNTQERPWNWLKQRHIANRVFTSIEDIVDTACNDWNSFVSQPNLIKSMCHTHWAIL